MKAAIFDLTAEARKDMGTGASRRLRRLQAKVPAIIYGGKKAAQSVTLEHHKILQALEHEAFYSHILTIDVDGKKEKVVLKDLQRAHASKNIMHLDFLRISDKEKIAMHVPIHFINESTAPGVKKGGSVSHQMIDIEIKCLAKDLPEFISVDLANLDIDKTLHLADIELPKGVEIPSLIVDKDNGNLPVATLRSPKGGKSDTETTTDESSDS